MLSIQQVGTEILGNAPRDFYVFGGSEYGIKRKYIQHLTTYYRDNKVEAASVLDVLNLMCVKHLIPLVPSVYVIRYDEAFLSQLNVPLINKFKSAKIVGTIVCIYEDSRSITKLNKFFPDNVASIEPVNQNMVMKYLRSDYPQLDDRFIQISATISDNYGHAQCICNSLSFCKGTILQSMTDAEIASLFGKEATYTDAQLKEAIASRSFRSVMSCLPSFVDRLDSVLYSFLSVAVELDKIFDNRWVDSDLSKFAKKWTRKDIYNLFMQAFHQLELIRSISADPTNCIYFLAALLHFKQIPSVKELS